MIFVWRRLWERLGARGVFVFKSAYRDSRRRLREHWDAPDARIARALTAVLTNTRDHGLGPTADGFYPVRDLLNLPALRGIDFLALERAVKRHRFHFIHLTYSPRKTGTAPDDESITSWWIKLRPRSSRLAFPPKRLAQPDEATEMVFKAPSDQWDSIREQGITRLLDPLKFSTQTIVPAKYVGDHTFIRLDPQKVLDATNHPIYSIRGHATRPRFHLYSQTFTTNAPVIPPSTFKSAARVTVERFPLILPLEEVKENASRRKKRRKGKEINQPKMVIMQSGIQALRRFGFNELLRGTKLLQQWNAQEEEEEKADKANQTQEALPLTPSDPKPKLPRLARSLSTKDPPPPNK